MSQLNTSEIKNEIDTIERCFDLLRVTLGRHGHNLEALSDVEVYKYAKNSVLPVLEPKAPPVQVGDSVAKSLALAVENQYKQNKCEPLTLPTDLNLR